MDARPLLAALVFVAVFILLALGRVGHRKLPRGAVALAGGVVTALLLRVPLSAIDLDVIALLAGLMLLAGLAAEAGLFAGVRRVLLAKPPAFALWLALLLVAATSAALLNDAAVVILVPFLWPALAALGLPAVPTIALMAVAANVGSLLTPFGNPQNAVLARLAGLGPWDFLVVQGPLVALGALLLGAASAWVARGAQPRPQLAPAPAAPNGRVAVACAALLFLGLAAAGIPLGPAAVGAALAAATAQALRGHAVHQVARKHVDLNVLALFVGMYLLTGGIPLWLDAARVPVASLGGTTATAAVTVGSNAIGNVPAILTLARLDAAWTTAHAAFLVTVSTLGGALLLSGSAASLIAAEQAKGLGIDVRFVPFLRVAVPVVLPLLLVGAWWTWR